MANRKKTKKIKLLRLSKKAKKAKEDKKASKPSIRKEVGKKSEIRKEALDNTIYPVRDYKSKKKAQSTEISNGVRRTKIRVIGIGGGSGSIISEIISRIKKADFVVANTDARALKEVRGAKRFQFGQSLTKGLGTGMNPELGEMAAQNDKEKIKKLFEDQDLCIIIACLGGGTSSGATPVFAKISRSFDCLTYGIFTLPFEFEGEKKMEIARKSLENIKPNLRAFSIIPNEKIFQIIDKNTPLKDALSAVNKKLADNLEGLIEMVYLPGLINIDFADLRTILSGRGRLAYLNTIEVHESNSVRSTSRNETSGKEETLKKVISSPLYPYTIKGARGILYNIMAGKTLQLSEVSQISKIIADSVNKNAKIIFGINQNSKNEGKIKITLLATGCAIKGILSKPSQKILSLIAKIKRPELPLLPEKREDVEKFEKSKFKAKKIKRKNIFSKIRKKERVIPAKKANINKKAIKNKKNQKNDSLDFAKAADKQNQQWNTAYEQ